jgi:metal-responsive CopG/Arc/MetJ family transcriptional regulator
MANVIVKTFSLTPELMKKIDENCQKYNFSKSEFIRAAIIRKIEKLYDKMIIVSDPDKIYIGGKEFQVKAK